MRHIFSLNAGQEVYDICNEGVLNVILSFLFLFIVVSASYLLCPHVLI